jgi:hypothetical protein
MTDRDRGHIGQDNDRWAGLRAAGLLRRGVHEDTTVTATAPDGSTVVIAVRPIRVNGGQDTLFVPPREEAASMARLFPKPARAI